MYTTTAGVSTTISTKIGNTTGFKQYYAQGLTGSTEAASGSIPTPTDSNFFGWILDSTLLEGQRIAAGTWTPTFKLKSGTSTTITPTVQWFKRSSAGSYTQLGSVTGSSMTLTTTPTNISVTPPSLAFADFAVGDKLCVWLWFNETAGGGAGSLSAVTESQSSDGVVGGAETDTPGYDPTPVALSVEFD